MTMTAPAPTTKTSPTKTGRVVQIIGPVVDVEFAPEHLPEIYYALEIDLASIVSTGEDGSASDSAAMKGIEANTGKLVLEVR